MGALVSAFFFSPTMPPEVAKARYHALVKVLHPDAPTGDTRLMQLVNAEFEALERGALTTNATPPPSFDPLGSYFAAVRQRAEAQIRLLPEMPGVEFEIDSPHRLIIAVGKHTYTYKEALKAFGFRWMPERRAWVREVNV